MLAYPRTKAHLAQADKASSTGGNDEAAIRAVMASYNDALNSGSAEAVLPLYAEDGVFMPPYSPSAVGKEAVRKASDAVFRELKFDVKFTIAELVVMDFELGLRADELGRHDRPRLDRQDHRRGQPGALHLPKG